MFRLFLFLALSSSSLFASISNPISRSQIMITEEGFLINIDGVICIVPCLTHIGDGIYTVSETYYGSCKRCGWPKNEKGKCMNKTCNGYGPNKD